MKLIHLIEEWSGVYPHQAKWYNDLQQGYLRVGDGHVQLIDRARNKVMISGVNFPDHVVLMVSGHPPIITTYTEMGQLLPLPSNYSNWQEYGEAVWKSYENK
jgi:hypothetical protein